jgi:hypothetical protein
MSYPTTVKSVGIKKNGGLEVIEDLELPFPEVHPGDMLVKVMNHPLLVKREPLEFASWAIQVQFAGVNFHDTYMRCDTFFGPDPSLKRRVSFIRQVWSVSHAFLSISHRSGSFWRFA